MFYWHKLCMGERLPQLCLSLRSFLEVSPRDQQHLLEQSAPEGH